MKKILEIFSNYIQSKITGEKYHHTQLSKEEFYSLSLLIENFSFLICYPDTNSFHNNEIARKVIDELKVFLDIYFISDERYDYLINKKSNVKQFMQSGIFIPNIEKHQYFNHYLDAEHFEKDDFFVYQYTQTLKNENHLIKISKNYKNIPFKISSNKFQNVTFNIHYLIPLIISPSNYSTYEKNLSYDEKNNVYQLKISDYANDTIAEIFNRFLPKVRDFALKSKFIFSIIEHSYCNYIKIGDDLVYEDLISNNAYETYLKERESSTKFLVVNKNGDINDGKILKELGVILHGIRTNIAHNLYTYDFVVEHEKNILPPYEGRFYITDWIDSDKCRAFILPRTSFNSLSQINKTNYNINEYSYLSIYCPHIEKYLTTEQQWESYLKRCKKIVLTHVSGIDRRKLDVSIDYFLENYDESFPLDEYLKNNLKNIFSNIDVKITPLDNIELLMHKIRNNPYFTKYSPQMKLSPQKNAISYIIKDFYSFDIVRTNAILPNGKFKEININDKNLIIALDNILRSILNINFKRNEIVNFVLFKDEIYIALCTFLIFTNIIYNGFNEDLNGKYSRINDIERRKIESRLNTEMFKGFTYINKSKKGHDVSKHVVSLEEMKNVIRKLRDNIAHFSVKVKFAKNANPDDNILLFGYENNDDVYFSITCKDLLNFLMNPLFLEYQSKKNEVIRIKSYDEIFDIVKEKMKQV